LREEIKKMNLNSDRSRFTPVWSKWNRISPGYLYVSRRLSRNSNRSFLMLHLRVRHEVAMRSCPIQPMKWDHPYYQMNLGAWIKSSSDNVTKCITTRGNNREMMPSW
jgi:hypothetical protein